jgi:hypothetical protein
MRLTMKSPRTGALVFLPFVLAFGCARKPEQAAPNYKDVIVTLELQPDGKLMPIPDFKTLKLSKKPDDRAHWKYCGDGDLNISMKPGSDNDPFEPGNWEHSNANHCTDVRSPKISPNAREKKFGQPYNPYKYTITVTGVTNTVPNDPDIEIMQ